MAVTLQAGFIGALVVAIMAAGCSADNSGTRVSTREQAQEVSTTAPAPILYLPLSTEDVPLVEATPTPPSQDWDVAAFRTRTEAQLARHRENAEFVLRGTVITLERRQEERPKVYNATGLHPETVVVLQPAKTAKRTGPQLPAFVVPYGGETGLDGFRPQRPLRVGDDVLVMANQDPYGELRPLTEDALVWFDPDGSARTRLCEISTSVAASLQVAH